MEILEKAKELGILIANSDTMRNLKKMELMVYEDEKAKRLIDEHKAVSFELMKGLKANLSKEDIEDLRASLMEKQRELNEYNVTRCFLESKKEFDALVKDVNNVMTYEITGKHACDGHNCSSCGSCGGH